MIAKPDVPSELSSSRGLSGKIPPQFAGRQTGSREANIREAVKDTKLGKGFTVERYASDKMPDGGQEK